MAGEMNVTVVGSITEPTLRFTQAGKPVVSFSLAHNNRVKDGDNWVDGEPTWFRVSAWDGLAENIAESLEKGARVIVTGRMSTRKWTTEAGEERSSLELQAEAVGAELRWATAQVTRSGGGAAGGAPRPAAQSGGMTRSRTAQPSGDPWSEDPPF